MQPKLLNIFSLPRLPDRPWIPILNFLWGVPHTNTLFQQIDPALYKGIFSVVEDPAAADYLLIPHTYASIKSNSSYIDECVATAKKYSKTLILFAYQDSAEPICIPRTIIFRASQYRSTLASYEIVMPAFVEDLGATYGHMPRTKRQKPVVGFVGKAGFENSAHYFRSLIKNIFRGHPFKDGLYYRRKAMAALSHDPRIETRFISRSSYSGNIKTIPVPVEQARQEYVNNMIESDFALAPKGDGNYSLRFFEALSFGRIPILIDTECVLPLEEYIPYKENILSVDYSDIEKLPDILHTAYTSWSEDEYARRQRALRAIFEEYLFMPSFLKKTFTREFLSRYEP